MTMEQGKPLLEAYRGEVMHPPIPSSGFAEEGKRAYGQIIPQTLPNKRHLTIKHPVGVVGGISPWNFPLRCSAARSPRHSRPGCTIVAKLRN